MNIDKPCHNSSCEPTATGRRSKKSSRIAQMHTESLTRIFLTFVFDANRFQTDLQALPLAAAEIKIIQHLILDKASAANLQDSFDSFD